jgi:hypothetical protein
MQEHPKNHKVLHKKQLKAAHYLGRVDKMVSRISWRRSMEMEKEQSVAPSSPWLGE